MLSLYNPHDWYWIVSGDESRLWSSRAKTYIAADHPDFAAFLASGRRPTRIGSEAELAQVLGEQYPAGSPRPPRHLTPLAFRRRFTEAERLAIHTAAQTDPAVAMWVSDGAAAQIIDLDDPITAAALQALVDAGLVTSTRRGEILG